MVIRVKVITVNIRAYGYLDPGKIDRRFKSGYRIEPFTYGKIEIQLRLQHNGSVRLRTVYQTPYGRMMCVARTESTCDLKLLSTGDFQPKLEVNAEFDIVNLFSTFLEIPTH